LAGLPQGWAEVDSLAPPGTRADGRQQVRQWSASQSSGTAMISRPVSLRGSVCLTADPAFCVRSPQTTPASSRDEASQLRWPRSTFKLFALSLRKAIALSASEMPSLLSTAPGHFAPHLRSSASASQISWVSGFVPSELRHTRALLTTGGQQNQTAEPDTLNWRRVRAHGRRRHWLSGRHPGIPLRRRKTISQSRSISPRSITSSGFSPSKASLGLLNHPPNETGSTTSVSAWNKR